MRPLAHGLPAYIMLANRLVRALKHQPGKRAEELGEVYRRDLRVLYEMLRPWFASAPHKTW
jgi:hypothetical protein